MIKLNQTTPTLWVLRAGRFEDAAARLQEALQATAPSRGSDPPLSSSLWDHGQVGREHRYQATITWTGNLGDGTAGYRSYSRSHEVSGQGKPVLPGSSDPAFNGDPQRWNPEELLVAALSQCHMLWFLHLCAVNGIVVISYTDDAQGTMAEGDDGGGEFTTVTLRPRAAIADSGQANRALELHVEAHRLCFIARSVNFPVSCEPVITGLQVPERGLRSGPIAGAPALCRPRRPFPTHDATTSTRTGSSRWSTPTA